MDIDWREEINKLDQPPGGVEGYCNWEENYTARQKG